MSSPFRFFHLPREIRDIIYEKYVYVDGGYKFDTLEWKLRDPSRPKHPFAFQQTCKQVHEEMEGYALRYNIISFTPMRSWPEGNQASRWQRMMCTGPVTLFDMQILLMWSARNIIDDDVRDQVAIQYPGFLPHLDWLRGPHPPNVHSGRDDRFKIYNTLGERPSLFREYMWFVMRSVYSTTMDDAPWEINSEVVLDLLAGRMEGLHDAILGRNTPRAASRTREYWEVLPDDDWLHYRHSAAAYAIEFLRRYPSDRLHMRNIVLEETRPSVAFPECHGKGLIEYCVENPLLRIERRVDLFMTVFSRPVGPAHSSIFGLQHRIDYTSNMSLWISEALALPDAISLVFTGKHVPGNSRRIFTNYIIPDARSRHALEVACERGMLDAPHPMAKFPKLKPTRGGGPRGGHFHKGVAEAIWQMCENKGNETGKISCDFDPGHSWDVEEVIKKRLYWSSNDWERRANWSSFTDNRGCRGILAFEPEDP